MKVVHSAFLPRAVIRSTIGFFIVCMALIIPFLTSGCQRRLPVPGPPICFADAESLKLKRVTRRYLDLIWALEPELAVISRLKTEEFTGSCADWQARIFTAQREARNLRLELDRVKVSGLTSNELEDRRILGDYLRALQTRIEIVHPWKNDPGFYLDKIDTAYSLALRIENQTARCEAFRHELANTGALVKAAKDNLHFPSLQLLKAAATRADVLARKLEKKEICPVPFQCNLQLEIMEWSDKVALVLRGFARDLRNYAGKTRPGSWVLGERRLARVLRLQAGILLPPGNLLGELNDDRDRLRLAWQKGRENRGKVVSNQAYLPGVQSLAAARAMCLDSGILPLSLFPSGITASHGWSEASMGTLSPDESLILARDGYPGVKALFEAFSVAKGGSILRCGHPCLLLINGWGSYAEDLWARALSTPDILARRDWNRLFECTCARLAVALQLGRLSIVDARRELEDELGLAAKTALVLAVRLARRPLAALGWVGGKAIHQLRNRVKAARRGVFLPACFHRQIMLTGPVPFSRLEAAVLAESAG